METQQFYIVHQGRPGNVARQSVIEGEQAAEALLADWEANASEHGTGLVGYGRARLRNLHGHWHWQAGRYSVAATQEQVEAMGQRW